MKSLKILAGLVIVVALVACGGGNKPATGGSSASTGLSLDLQFNTVAPDTTNYSTYTGPLGSVEKDTYDPAHQVVEGGVTVTGASIKGSTVEFNVYRNDATGKSSLPGMVRSLVLFPVADDATRVNDKFTATKGADGVITVMFAHRGTAVRFTTAANGRITVPSASWEKRSVGKVGDKGVEYDTAFATDGTVATLDWAKVWNKSVGTTAIEVDAPASTTVKWTGELQVGLNNNILTIKGDLQPKS